MKLGDAHLWGFIHPIRYNIYIAIHIFGRYNFNLITIMEWYSLKKKTKNV